MTTINDILTYFEGFAPVSTAMDFDNCGLLVGDKNTAITNVLVSLDITAEVVYEAQRFGCELIISHHPVIFNPIKKLNSSSVPYLLASFGIAAVCMHTNLDLSEEFGVNTCLGKAAGLRNICRAESGECLFVGELDEEISVVDVVTRLKTALDCQSLRYTEGNGKVRKIAVSSGAGGSDIFAAAEEGADIFITGEIKHHEINAANELGIAIADVGHFKSEDVVINPLIERLKKQFPDTGFTKSKEYSDKIKYL